MQNNLLHGSDSPETAAAEIALWFRQEEKPLPEPTSFMSEFRKTLHSDNTLLSQYTYTEKETELTLYVGELQGELAKREPGWWPVSDRPLRHH